MESLDVIKARVKTNQDAMKCHFDSDKHFNCEALKPGDWVLIKNPKKVMKGVSRFSSPAQVTQVSRGSALLANRGWWNKPNLVLLTNAQADIIMNRAALDADCMQSYSWLWDTVVSNPPVDSTLPSSVPSFSQEISFPVTSLCKATGDKGSARLRKLPDKFKDYVLD